HHDATRLYAARGRVAADAPGSFEPGPLSERLDPTTRKVGYMSLSPEEIRRRYARLVVECGWGGRRGIAGKPVHVYHGVDAYPLLLAIAEEAYKQGAIRVDYTTWSPRLDALHVTYATDESLTAVPATWADRWNDLVDVRGATLRI